MSNEISATILSIVNLSIRTGTLKSSTISPLLKNLHWIRKMSNYRIIANLSFISKLTQKIVKKRLLDHLTSNSLLNHFKLPIPNDTLPRLHYFPYMTIFIMPSLCNKSPAFIFLIYLLHLILSTTQSYSIVFLPDLAFSCFTTMVNFLFLIRHIYFGVPFTQFLFITSYMRCSPKLRSRPSSFQFVYHSC